MKKRHVFSLRSAFVVGHLSSTGLVHRQGKVSTAGLLKIQCQIN